MSKKSTAVHEAGHTVVAVESQRQQHRVKATRKKWALAYHEAGHAVVAADWGAAIRYVTIERDGDTLGKSVSSGAGGRVQIAELLAGPLTEWLLRFSPTPFTEGGYGDFGEVYRLLRWCPEEEREGVLFGALTGVRLSLSQHWQVLQEVAEALCELGTVSGDVIEARIQESTANVDDSHEVAQEIRRVLADDTLGDIAEQINLYTPHASIASGVLISEDKNRRRSWRRKREARKAA